MAVPPPGESPSRPSFRATAIVVAAGTSSRLPGTDRKPFLRLGGRTVLEHACAALAAAPQVEEIVVVAHAEDVARVRELGRRSDALLKVTKVVPGGPSRTDSVRAGVQAASPEADVLCIHDAARPLVEPEVVERALRVAFKEGAALVGLPVQDTIKASSSGAYAEGTLDRSVLWAAQTPQVFRSSVLRDLLERADRDGFAPTDDAALYERYVGPVPMVPGNATNLKITTPADLAIAEALLARRAMEGL